MLEPRQTSNQEFIPFGETTDEDGNIYCVCEVENLIAQPLISPRSYASGTVLSGGNCNSIYCFSAEECPRSQGVSFKQTMNLLYGGITQYEFKDEYNQQIRRLKNKINKLNLKLKTNGGKR